MIKRVKVEVHIEHMHCDKCDAVMERGGMVLMCDPPIYHYQCTACANVTHDREAYPRPVYTPTEATP